MPPASVISMLRLALACLVLGLFAVVPAANAASTTQILRDCADDGVLQGDYTPAELRKARQNIPTDTDEYTDCRDVLARAAAAGVSSRGGVAAVGRLRRRRRRRPAAGRTRTRPRAAQIVGEAGAKPPPGPMNIGGRSVVPGKASLSAGRRAQRAAAGHAGRADPARRRRPLHPPAPGPPPCPRSPRALNQRVASPHTRTITVPWAGPNGWLTGGVALVILLATFVARGGVRLEPTSVGRDPADARRRGARRRGVPAAGRRAALRRAVPDHLRAARRLHGALDRVVAGARRLVAGGRPHARLPRGRRRRRRARAADAGLLERAAVRRARRHRC